MATILWECESENMGLLHIPHHLLIWGGKKRLYIGMKTIWIWYQGAFD